MKVGVLEDRSGISSSQNTNSSHAPRSKALSQRSRANSRSAGTTRPSAWRSRRRSVRDASALCKQHCCICGRYAGAGIVAADVCHERRRRS